MTAWSNPGLSATNHRKLIGTPRQGIATDNGKRRGPRGRTPVAPASSYKPGNASCAIGTRTGSKGNRPNVHDLRNDADA